MNPIRRWIGGPTGNIAATRTDGAVAVIGAALSVGVTFAGGLSPWLSSNRS